MPSGLVSNLSVAFNFTFPRVKQSQSLHLVETLFSRKSSVLRHSRNLGNTKNMAASGSVVASGDLVVDALMSGCGNVSSFVKPGGVFFGDRSYNICRSARVGMNSGGVSLGRHGFRACVVFDFERTDKGGRFSLRSYSDGVVPEVSTDESLRAEELSSLAIPAEQSLPEHNPLKLLSGVCYLPHPDKEETGGEDAHFILADEQVIGVADGVGGWADVGVNAGDYARELMSNCVKAIKEAPSGNVKPLQVLKKAHAATNAMGSSTACIVALKNQDLHAINLGDSGFIVVRDGHVVFESPVQQHGFNFTYQLERGNSGDLPSSGQIFKIPVAPGDVVVVGSDGLFDNLYNKETASIVSDAVREGLGPDAMAQNIAAFARAQAMDRRRQSPFSKAAQKAGFTYYGGKLDDLTVVVSYVST